MSQTHPSSFPGLGYEEPQASAIGRLATWTVFVVMVLGAWGAVALSTGWLLTAAEGVSFLIALQMHR